MCKGCLARKDFDNYCKYVKNIQRWLKTGKNREYINNILSMSCPNGRRHCKMCGLGNGGKSSQKGKGKNKKNIM
jgi:hypothetical protein